MPEDFPRLAELRDRRIPAWRAELATRLMQRALQHTILGNPVDTARSRAAWVRALTAFGGEPPPGWQGSQPEPAAIRDGSARSSLSRADTDTRSTRTATSSVDYVNLLEHGTARMKPFHMVRRALHQLRSQLPRLLPPL